MAFRQAYVARTNRVIDHIDAHLAEALSLDTLAAVANFSPWHFHRVFQAMTGETLADRVRRRRLEVAASRLLGTPQVAAQRIAEDVGFASAAVFTRAFGAYFGMTPSAWRRGGFGAWSERQRDQLHKIHQAQRKTRQQLAQALQDDSGSWSSDHPLEGDTPMNVELQTQPTSRVAYLRHVGPYGDPAIGRLWLRFEAWCGAQGFNQPRHNRVGIAQDSPDITAPEKCRYDCCVEVDAAFQPQGEIGVQTLPGGRYASTRFSGSADQIHMAWERFFATWLPDSGYQVDDRPCFELYDQGAEVDAASGAFTCLLCLPIRPM